MSFGKRNIPVNAPQVDWLENDSVTTRIVRERSNRVLRHHMANISRDNRTVWQRIKGWLNSEAF